MKTGIVTNSVGRSLQHGHHDERIQERLAREYIPRFDILLQQILQILRSSDTLLRFRCTPNPCLELNRKVKEKYKVPPEFVAGMLEEYGRDIPSASSDELIVFAVYIPPQPPGPGQAWRTTSKRCSSVIWPIV